MTQARESRRADILRAAFEEFCGGGYDRTRMEHIARRAGIGKSTIYEYFPSKTELLTAVGEWMFENACKALHEIFSKQQPFRDMVYHYLKYMSQLMVKAGAGLLSIRGEDSTFEVVYKCGEQFRDFILKQLMDAVTKAQQRGEIAQDLQAEAVASLIISLSSPVILTAVTEDWEEHMQQIINVLFKGLQPRVSA